MRIDRPASEKQTSYLIALATKVSALPGHEYAHLPYRVRRQYAQMSYSGVTAAEASMRISALLDRLAESA